MDSSPKRLPAPGGSFLGIPFPVSLTGPPDDHDPLLPKKLRWSGSWDGGWCPHWSHIQPRMEDIRTVATPFAQFCGLDADNLNITSFKQGMWNRLYLLTSTNERTGITTERIFRVPIPVNPWYKVQSDVATTEFVRAHTSIPVPKIYVFESSMDNTLGFEWMIMEKVEGTAYKDLRDSLSHEVKAKIHRSVAIWVDQLCRLPFDQIGSVYREWDSSKENYLQFYLGPDTADYFLGPWRVHKEFSRGPFRNEAEFYRAMVDMHLQDVLDPRHLQLAEQAWAEAEAREGSDSDDDNNNSDDRPELTTVYSEGAFDESGVQKACDVILDSLHVVEDQLASRLPRKYFLYHFDMSHDNIILNDVGDAVALLDWENISTISLSMVYPWPSMINSIRWSKPRAYAIDEPRPKYYADYEEQYKTRLTADVFMTTLTELESPWPQMLSIDREYEDEFEKDLAKLDHKVKTIYTRWDNLDMFSKLKEKYLGSTSMS